MNSAYKAGFVLLFCFWSVSRIEIRHFPLGSRRCPHLPAEWSPRQETSGCAEEMGFGKGWHWEEGALGGRFSLGLEQEVGLGLEQRVARKWLF